LPKAFNEEGILCPSSLSPQSLAAPSSDKFTGYRILSSKDAIEIFYHYATFGSVKISLERKNNSSLSEKSAAEVYRFKNSRCKRFF
jgi:hypothetical protein